jgi:hypothetical protein
MSTAKHAQLAEYIQQHKQNWDLDFMVVMPGEAGKQLFEEYPLSDQSVVARQHGRKGGKAGKGKPKGGKTAKGVKRAPYKCGVIQTPQELLLAFQQEFSSRD